MKTSEVLLTALLFATKGDLNALGLEVTKVDRMSVIVTKVLAGGMGPG